MAVDRDDEQAAAGAAEHGFGEFARQLSDHRDQQQLLDHIATAAVTEIPAATCAGIMLVGRGGHHTAAATSDLIEPLHAVQYRHGAGPCLDASRSHRPESSNDLAAEPRWHDFCLVATQLGIRSVLALELFTHDHAYGALNVYSDRADAFGETDEAIGVNLAAHAVVAIRAEDTERGLREALAWRDVIGQAKGILMERHRLSAAQAFDLLVRTSQDRNRKLREVAALLASTGELPH